MFLMRINYKFILALIILIVIPYTLALTPYKIEVKELPIHATDVGSPESRPSIYKNIIAYRSGSNQISVYDLTNDQTKNIIDSYFAVIKPRVYNNYVLYQQYDRNGATDLMKYNLLTNKTYIISPVDRYTNFGSSVYPFSLIDNKIIAYVGCDSNSYSQDQQYVCKQNVLKNIPYGMGIVIFDLFNDMDYPPSIDLVKCTFNEPNYINGNYLIKPFLPTNPKEPVTCEKCNIFTGEKEYLQDSYCKQDIDTDCGKGFLTDTGIWSIGNDGSLCYSNKNTNLSIKNIQNRIGEFNFDVYNDKIIFFIGNEESYFGQILYGDLKDLCVSYSDKIVKSNLEIVNNCYLNQNNSCTCNFIGNGTQPLFNDFRNYTFNLININEKSVKNFINQTYLEIEIERNTEIDTFNKELENQRRDKERLLEEAKEKKLKELQDKISKEKEIARKKQRMYILIFFIIMSIIGLIIIMDYNKTRNLLKRRQKINARFFIWRKYLVELERNRIVKEKKKYEKLEKIRIEMEKEAKKAEEFKKSQEAKGLVKYKNKWGTPEQIKKWKEVDYGIDKDFMNLKPFEFEGFIAKLFKKMGYEVTLTKKTGDFGIDVIARGKSDIIAIQVKHYNKGNNVSNVTVQQILGSMQMRNVKANKAIIITTSDFTIQAKQQAEETPVELWNLKTLKQMVRKYFIELDK